MQKLKLKNRFISISLVFFAVTLVFFGASEDVHADNKITFEVTLQTPFAKLPSQPCPTPKSASKDDYRTDESGNHWVCRRGSTEWQQIISGEDGDEILKNYAELIYKWLAGFIGISAVLLIVIGGIQISTAGANQEGLQSGKDRIFAALIGLALLFLSGLILHTINPIFFN